MSAPLLDRSILFRLIAYRLKGRSDRHAVVRRALRGFSLPFSLCQFFDIDLIVNHAVLLLYDKLVRHSSDSIGSSELGPAILAIDNVFAVLHREIDGIALSGRACRTEER